jgi:hypothetical protein
VIAIVFAAFLTWDVLRKDKGTPAMKKIADYIFVGAMAFMRRQYTTIGILAVVAAVLIAILLGFLSQTDINSDGETSAPSARPCPASSECISRCRPTSGQPRQPLKGASETQ